ncbi:MAG: phosphatidate cytidylyltransferase [Proteobacteria bacterium]|nr:phosphatidate cytidylyltransferase [Pseudomonadota bacterium]
MHLKRILSGIVAIPCLYLIIAKGGLFWFAVLISVAALIALSEYYFIVLNKQNESVFGPVSLIGYLVCEAIIFSAYRYPDRFEYILGLLVLNYILAGMITLIRYTAGSNVLDVMSKQVQGSIYVPLFISSLVFIRSDSDNGVAWIFYVLVLVAFCDTGAFYAGTFFGKHKLCPKVSPGKTVEGFMGGLALALAGGLGIKYYFFPELPLIMTVVFLLTVSVIGPVGDLFESALKRNGGVKDSGSIIPGHGGILDRIDALLFVAPVAYVFKAFLM